MAQAGKRVVLADVLEEGWGTLEPYVKETALENLTVVTAGSRVTNPAVLLASERMLEVLGELRERGDIVLLDSPPVLYVSDALMLAGEVDQVLLVLGSGMVKKEAARQSRDALAMVQAKRVDVVLNKISRETDAYSYYHYRSKPTQPSSP